MKDKNRFSQKLVDSNQDFRTQKRKKKKKNKQVGGS